MIQGQSLENDRRRLALTDRTINSSSSWYNGLAIKQYLQKNVFDLKSDFKNSGIVSGRWTAYCHYSAIVALENLLHKNELNEGDTVLIHPLTPASIVDRIVRKKVKIVSFDIEKETLNWSVKKFQDFIGKQKIDMVFFFAFNGIYEQIVDCVKLMNTKSVPSIVFVDSPHINSALLRVFDVVEIGGALWDFGDSFVDDVLNEVLPQPLQTKRWFVSWNIESRTTSLLEYHLSDSQENFKAVLEAYSYLLSEKIKKSGLVSRLKSWGLGRAGRSFNGVSDAHGVIKRDYMKILNSAVPDIFFELHRDGEAVEDEKEREDILYKSGLLQTKADGFYNYFSSMVHIRPTGELEIPALQIKKTYLEYFFYTTERGYWQENLKPKGIDPRAMLTLYPAIASMPNMDNTLFANSFLFSIDLVKAMYDDAGVKNY